jgi:hypothetical protein
MLLSYDIFTVDAVLLIGLLLPRLDGTQGLLALLDLWLLEALLLLLREAVLLGVEEVGDVHDVVAAFADEFAGQLACSLGFLLLQRRIGGTLIVIGFFVLLVDFGLILILPAGLPIVEELRVLQQ